MLRRRRGLGHAMPKSEDPHAVLMLSLRFANGSYSGLLRAPGNLRVFASNFRAA
jgi:hypothetical protein